MKSTTINHVNKLQVHCEGKKVCDASLGQSQQFIVWVDGVNLVFMVKTLSIYLLLWLSSMKTNIHCQSVTIHFPVFFYILSDVCVFGWT